LKRIAARIGAPSAFSDRVTIASAAHAAVPALAVVAVLPAPSDGKGGASAFASQLSGLTAEADAADAGAWRSAAPAAVDRQPVVTPGAGFTLPENMSSLFGSGNMAGTGTDFILPKSLPKAAGTPKPPVAAPSSQPKSTRRQAASSDSAQTAPATVPLAAPTPEIAATTAAPTGDSTTDDDLEMAVRPAVSHTAPPEAAEPAPPAASTTTHAQPAQEMAFATKVQPVQAAEHAALPAEMASAAAMASANRKVVAAAEDENPSPADAPGLMAATAAVERTAGFPSNPPSTASSTAAAAAPAAHAEGPSSPADNLPKASAPLKDISMQVTQPGKERVDVRVVQQGSEVHISVHSADAGMTSGLRQGLSELQGKLEENGYRSEMWKPGVSTAPIASAPSGQASTNHSRGGDGQPQQGGPQQESGRRNPNQSNQPRWVEELESSLDGGGKSSGGFYGFGS
jgi:hypothetical protein